MTWYTIEIEGRGYTRLVEADTDQGWQTFLGDAYRTASASLNIPEAELRNETINFLSRSSEDDLQFRIDTISFLLSGGEELRNFTCI
jgi:hypothetical protein